MNTVCNIDKLEFAEGTADQALLPPPIKSHGICLPIDGQQLRCTYADQPDVYYTVCIFLRITIIVNQLFLATKTYSVT
jgi:hypothetical protein